DIEDCIDSFERVSNYNRWDDNIKLANVAFYLVDVAKTWFLNHEDEIPNWTSFTTKIREIFGTPTSRKENAKKLHHRQQKNEETYSFCIEDVLTLCQRADADMRESDRVDKNPPTTSELRQIIREIVREEMKKLNPETPATKGHGDLSTDLRALVQGELAYAASTARPRVEPKQPTYVEMATRLPTTSQVVPQPQCLPSPTMAPLTHAPTNAMSYPPWRLTNSTPVCYYCGNRGHIVQYCRKRRSDERYESSRYHHDREPYWSDSFNRPRTAILCWEDPPVAPAHRPPSPPRRKRHGEVTEVLELGPTYCRSPRLNPIEKLSIARSLSEREPHLMKNTGVQQRPFKTGYAVSFFEEHNLNLFKAYKEGRFVVHPEGFFEDNSRAAIVKNFSQVKNVSPSKLKVAAKKLCRRLELTKRPRASQDGDLIRASAV
ncbi:hypothetical protein HPB47_002897, partial [Ixodes persulcatus]